MVDENEKKGGGGLGSGEWSEESEMDLIPTKL